MNRGFTLIELMVAVAIVAILTAVSIPQYRLLVVKSHRAAGVSILKNVDNAQMAYYAANDQYYPPNCATQTPGCIYAGISQIESINEYLGLGRFYQISGWNFTNDYTGSTGYATRWINPPGGPPKSMGYHAHLTKDIDNIPNEGSATDKDWMVVHRNWAWGNPDQGTPFLHFDDLLNAFGPY